MTAARSASLPSGAMSGARQPSASPRHAELANATAAAETSAEIRHVLSEPERHAMAAFTTALIAVLTCCLLGTLVAYCTTVCAVQPQS